MIITSFLQRNQDTYIYIYMFMYIYIYITGESEIYQDFK